VVLPLIKKVSGRPRELTAKEILFLTLIYMRQYVVYDVLSWIFEVDNAGLSRYINFAVTILFDTFKDYIKFPDRVKRVENLRWFHNNITNEAIPIVMCIDGSEQQVLKCGDSSTEQLHWSAKKGKHTYIKLLACAPTGEIYFLSKTYPGGANDQAIYNIPENQLHKMVDIDEGALMDAGFAIVPDQPKFVPAKKKPNNSELSTADLEFNRRIKEIRIVVENVFASIKRWSICSDIIRLPVKDGSCKEFHNKVWTIVAAFHNKYGESLRKLN